MPHGNRQLSLEDLSWLRALARSLVRDPHRADDAVQEAALAALRSSPRTEGARRGWLRSVLHNALRQEARAGERRTAREQARPAPEAAATPPELLGELAWHRRLVEHVEALDEPFRTAIVLRYLRERSVREIARELGVPPGTVRSRVERGLARLRERLDREARGDRTAWVGALLPLARPRPLPVVTGVLMSVTSIKGAAIVLAAVAVGVVLVPQLRDGRRTEPVESEGLATAPTELAAPDALHQGASVARAPVVPREALAGEPPTAPEPAPTGQPTFHGLVRTFEGRPVEGVRVVVERERSSAFTHLESDPEALSDADGGFELPVPDAAGRLSVEDPRLVAVARPWIDGAPSEPPLVVVAPRAEWAGQVVDGDGAPLEGARVEVTLAGDWLQAREIAGRPVHLLLPFCETLSDADGRFRFPDAGVVPGALVLARRDGHEDARVTPPPRPDDTLLLVLERSVPDEELLDGLVLGPDGMPVHDARVSLGGAEVRSDTGGRFSLPWLGWHRPGDRTTVWAVTRGLMPASAEVERGAEAEPVVLRLGAEPLTIEGRVLDVRGEPVPGAAVWSPDSTYYGAALHEMGGTSLLGESTVEALVTGREDVGPVDRSISAVADADGRFVLEGLLDRDYALFALAPKDLSAAQPVLARGGARGVVLRVAPEDVRPVSGRVTSLGGVPLAGLRISALRGLDDPFEPRTTSWDRSPLPPPSASFRLDHVLGVTDEDGAFSLPPVEVNGTTLWLEGGGVLLAATHRLSERDDLEALEIRVRARCLMRVVLEDPRRADAAGFVQGRGGFQPMAVRVGTHVVSTPHVEVIDGRSGIVEAGEGEHVLVLYREGEEVARTTIVLEPGDVTEIRL